MPRWISWLTEVRSLRLKTTASFQPEPESEPSDLVDQI
jgi:hypothetical protein